MLSRNLMLVTSAVVVGGSFVASTPLEASNGTTTAPATQALSVGAAGSLPGSTPVSVATAAPPSKIGAASMSSVTTASTASAAATASLSSFVQLQRAGAGIATPSSGSPSTLGKPLERAMVHLSAVKAYVDGQNVSAALFDKDEVLYFILLEGGAMSSVTVRQRQNGKWEAAIFDDGNLVRDVEAIRSTVSAVQDSALLIDIPTLKAWLLVAAGGANMTVVPVYDIPSTSLKRGLVYRFGDVLKTLQPIALALGAGNQ